MDFPTTPLRYRVAIMNIDNLKASEQLPPLAAPRYTDRLGKHLSNFVPNLKSDGYTPTKISDHILPEAMWAWKSIEERNLLHRWSNHVRSSQAFAVNLFAPLDDSGLATILSSIFGAIRFVEKPLFEFEDFADRLGESISSRPHRTQVDVLLQGTTELGRRVALLIEVKLSEDDFGHCSAFENPKNDSISVCGQDGPFGNDTNNCFQLRNHGGKSRRNYDSYLNLKSIPVHASDSGCWYKYSASQPMRNVALASVLSTHDGLDTRYAVCAPLLHREMWNHWDEVKKVLPADMVYTLPAELVASLHDINIYTYLSDRYFLNDDESFDPHDIREATTWKIVAGLDERFNHQLKVIETHPGGGQYDCISLVDTRNGRNQTVIDLNRNGSIHILHGNKEGPIADGWERAENGQLNEVIRDIGNFANLTQRNIARNSSWSLFARSIELFMRAGETSRWENGHLDASDATSVRYQRYDKMHIPHPQINESGDFLQHAAYSDWFLIHKRQKSESAICRQIIFPNVEIEQETKERN